MTKSPVHLSSGALDRELHRIGRWWLDHMIDDEFGGFCGEVDNSGRPLEGAPKNVILNTRILWFFSEAFRVSQHPSYLDGAKRAFDYLVEFFVDEEQGGLFWQVDATGRLVESRKQTYAQAFGIYALSAYLRVTHDKTALDLTTDIFDKIETHARDGRNGGYLEGFTREWKPLQDMRLSEVDANTPKSMNNHLHVLEAYTGLLQVKADDRVAAATRDLLWLFRDRIVDPDAKMRLFFSDDWLPMGGAISCGHDIEASWLLLKAGQALGDAELLNWLEPLVIRMGHTCADHGMHQGRYVINEIGADGHRDLSSPWWVQAEALVGFLWMYDLTTDAKFLRGARNIWQFIQEQHLDYENGEWLWDARQDSVSAHRDYKAGAWKGPYHNGRAMMEGARLMRRIEGQLSMHSEPDQAQFSHG